MWHDNETTQDLLGFEHLTSTITYLIEQKTLLPLTIGIFGDWGSGKSSLMQMTKAAIETKDSYVCVHFSPWQYEGYDDVKAALMATVMNTLLTQRPLFEKIEESVAQEARTLGKALWRRISVMRAIGLVAKGVSAVALHAHGVPAEALLVGAANDAIHLVKPDKVGETIASVQEQVEGVLKDPDTNEQKESLEQSIEAFRKDFEQLLKDLPLNALVVFIDDLDRCLPDTIIDTFEALRLFLAVRKTAFVVGADERIIQHAIATRYPELPGQAVNIGRDYLEKIVQIPVRIPPMTTSELEGYLNLLGCQLYLQEASLEKSLAIAATNRQQKALDVAMNAGILHSHLAAIPAQLEEHMLLVGRIAPILSRGMQGNPRQTKRFMNTLLLRKHMAEIRSVPLDIARLAKLMLLEYFHEIQFRQLFGWQQEGQGIADPLAIMEKEVQNADPKVPQAQPELSPWFDNPHIVEWLRLEPPLARVNLGPYFYIARERIGRSTLPTQRLSQTQQELLAKLLSDSDSVREVGKNEAKSLPSAEFLPVYEEVLNRFQREPGMHAGKLGTLIVTIAVEQRTLVAPLERTLRQVPLSGIQSALALSIVTAFGTLDKVPAELVAILRDWSSQTTNLNLARSAQRAISSSGRRP